MSSSTSVSARSSSVSSYSSNTSTLSSLLTTQISTSSSSTPALVGGLCLSTECELGGDFFCETQDQICFQTAAFPCIQCEGTTLSSASSSSAFSAFIVPPSLSPSSTPPAPPVITFDDSCTGTECSDGGSEFCGVMEQTCKPASTSSCFACITQTTAIQFDSFNLLPPGVPAITPPEDYVRRIALGETPAQVASLQISTAVPSCRCASTERCVSNQCLSPEEIQKLPPFCGNARLDAGESCDEGSLNTNHPNALCRTDCTMSRCGDGILDTPLELCDDGNTDINDGCSSVCTIERSAPTPTGTLPATVIELPLSPSSPPLIAGVPSNQQNPTYPTPPKNSDTGPAALALMIAGASAGYAWMRRRRL